MPKNIRLSGVITDNDPKELRSIRAKLLYHLFFAGFNIYNGNGDQGLDLWSIQKKIGEADGFVFMPGARLDDIVKASSIFVGYQTGDKDLDGKPSVLLNPRGSWNQWLELIEHLHTLGTVSQKWNSIIKIVEKPKQVVEALRQQTLAIEKIKTTYGSKPPEKSIKGDTSKKKPKHSVCVFCSASTKDPELIEMGINLGTKIAGKGWGCVSGAGRTGIMGAVVKGAYDNGGWTGGSNIPHIIKLEGLPDGMNDFWPTTDIYKRMEVMIDRSEAFAILPGGMGTVQELLVLLDLKRKDDPLMRKKPIVMINPKVKIPGSNTPIGFWDPLIELTKRHKVQNLYKITEDLDKAISYLRPRK